MEVTSTESSTEASMEASTGAMKASVEAVEAFLEAMEASMEAFKLPMKMQIVQVALVAHVFCRSSKRHAKFREFPLYNVPGEANRCKS